MSACAGIDSDDEVVTQICRTYREDNVYPTLSQALDTQLFEGSNATRANVGALLANGGVHLITGSGHGFAERFTGQGRLSILEIGAYAPIEVTGSIVHLLSCNTAQRLGEDLIANGCRAFFGYDEEFVFPEDAAPLFLEADSQIDLALAAGGTAADAYDAAIAAFNRHIVRLLQLGKILPAGALKRNRDHLCAPSVDAKWGDANARLSL